MPARGGHLLLALLAHICPPSASVAAPACRHAVQLRRIGFKRGCVCPCLLEPWCISKQVGISAKASEGPNAPMIGEHSVQRRVIASIRHCYACAARIRCLLKTCNLSFPLVAARLSTRVYCIGFVCGMASRFTAAPMELTTASRVSPALAMAWHWATNTILLVCSMIEYSALHIITVAIRPFIQPLT